MRKRIQQENRLDKERKAHKASSVIRIKEEEIVRREKISDKIIA